ncbi:hypothetical protein RchiOBHm_Chr5g0033781 [Rosa chinensis]|uniref:Uncharacterized protein n=1 Tax=Rosa chinensis TaxID=74649 RepID=A0A2P6QAU4_ROSCH|nr:hypothetical protein RchiOBHm_Chr5g0033781 [Rosa chinensis]
MYTARRKRKKKKKKEKNVYGFLSPILGEFGVCFELKAHYRKIWPLSNSLEFKGSLE